MRMKSHKQISEQLDRIAELAEELYVNKTCNKERYYKFVWHIGLDRCIDWKNNIYHYVRMHYPSIIVGNAHTCEPSHFDRNIQFPDWVYKTNWLKVEEAEKERRYRESLKSLN